MLLLCTCLQLLRTAETGSKIQRLVSFDVTMNGRRRPFELQIADDQYGWREKLRAAIETWCISSGGQGRVGAGASRGSESLSCTRVLFDKAMQQAEGSSGLHWANLRRAVAQEAPHVTESRFRSEKSRQLQSIYPLSETKTQKLLRKQRETQARLGIYTAAGAIHALKSVLRNKHTIETIQTESFPSFSYSFPGGGADSDQAQASTLKLLEPGITRIWEQELEPCCAQNGLVLDVGANYGYYS